MSINISSLITDDERRLLKRCEELFSRAEQGIPSATQFLNSRERFIIEHMYSKLFSSDESDPICFFFGGFPDAQRNLLCFFPAYYRYSITGECPAEGLREELSEYITPIRIKASGYVNLSHRDYLGAIIGLGIERTSVGDILPDSEGATVFVSPSVSSFLKNELIYIGRDKVKASDIALPADFNFTQSFDVVRGTVASPRLDAVVSELTNCSRETAKTVIRQGLCEHNHFPAAEPDAEVTNGDIISVRKSSGTKGGKFIVDSLDERSAKGRIRLAARRYL